MRKTELIVSGEVIHPKTKASIVAHEHTNVEALLDQQNRTSSTITQSSAMSQVGVGDDMDLSFCVEDGFYESATLYGKTMVNCIQEPSSQDVVLPYEFEDGQYVTINDTKESGALGVELKGQTLVNLATTESAVFRITGGEKIRDTDGYFILDSENKDGSGGGYYEITFKYPYSYNKTYTVMIYVVENSLNEVFRDYGFYGIPVQPNQTGVFIKTFNVNYDDSIFRASLSPTSSGRIKFGFVMLEGDYANQYIPYFYGMQSVEMPVLSTVGKNLFNYFDLVAGKIIWDTSNNVNIFEDGWYQGSADGVGFALRKCIKVKPNTKYYANFPHGMHVMQYKANGDLIKGNYPTISTGYVTTSSKTHYINLFPSGGISSAWNEARRQEYQNCYISESEAMTSYEPYKSSSLSTPKDIELRSIGSLCDTLDCKTGEYVKRIGMGLIDGTVNGSTPYGNGDPRNGTFCVEFSANSAIFKEGALKHSSTPYVSPQMPFRVGIGVEGVYIAKYSSPSSSVIVRVPANTYPEAMNWLKENPVTFTYELATPVVTKINLPSTLKSWNTTTHIYSEIPENTLYPILSHSNPTYPVILKPSTKYSIVANSYSNGHTNSPINFNLGGATASTTVGNRVTTVTTPSTLSNELLTMSGRGNKLNNVMVIEGDVVGDEPYFEGICDCKSPVLLNIGKNLFNVNDLIKKHNNPSSIEITKTNTGFNMKSKHTGAWHATNYSMQLKPNTQYIFNCVANTKSNTGSIKLWNDCELFHVYRDVFLQNTANLEINITFTTQKDGILKFQLNTTRDISALGDVEVSNVSLYELTNQTTYEPYKSNTTTFNQKDDKTIVLRSLPSGVCDTLNVETGEYVQRIGEIVFDGSETWEASNWETNSHFAFRTGVITDVINIQWGDGRTLMVCDILPVVVASNQAMTLSSDFITLVDGRKFIVKLSKKKLTGGTVDNFKQWLQQNPITVQYELATPIASTIDVQGFPYAYTNGHVQLSSGHSGQSLTPKVEYVVQTNRAGAIQANQDRLLNHDKRLAMLEDLVLHQLIQLEYNRAKCTLLSQTRQIFEGGIQMYHTKYELLSEFIEKKLYRSLEEVFEMLDVYFMLGDITDGEYDALYEALMPSAEEIFEVEETFDHEDVEV